ncbi:MAG: entericidin A/B family lipoprotein [Proteobacteria bacterium]|nr:entericidin A/B family lipoprotein [Pseudomonadota bacterium]
MNSLTKQLLTAAALASLVTLVGCNTVEGAGKDVKAAGGAVEKAADKAKPN